MNPLSANKKSDEAWRELAELFAADGESVLLSRTYPPVGKMTADDAGPAMLSFLDALSCDLVAPNMEEADLGAELRARIDALIHQLSVFESVGRCPIMAITGLLNAGKSSLLASYLSPQNRHRILTGLNNDSGTHRFVLWLPKVWWDDGELLNTLISFISGVFGHPPEHLSEDPEVAALQSSGKIRPEEVLQRKQSRNDSEESTTSEENSKTRSNQVDPMDVPLIAYDESLNELKLGLVDCPDIQTGFLGARTLIRGEDLADLRRDQLRKIGRLCSAFIVVSKMSSLHDDSLLDILQTLRDAMPGVPRMLAVNKVKARYTPEVVFEQARCLQDRYAIRSIYCAYDFRSSLADTRIPPKPTRMQDSPDGSSQPIFFECSKTAWREDSSTRTASSFKYLHDLGEELDIGNLTRESSRSLKIQLKSASLSAQEWMTRCEQLLVRQRTDAWQALADACYEFMAERDGQGNNTGLRLQASPAIVSQMADSIQRTAPTWMKFSLRIDKTARQLHQAVANSASRLKILQSASESVSVFAKRFKQGDGAQVVTPQRLAKAVKSCDIHDAFHRSGLEQLEAGCDLAMRRFAEEDKTELDGDELDKWSEQIWKQMSFREKLWKSTQPLAVMMAPLLAVILVPIDAGGSAVLVFASIKELLAAAGIAAVMTPMATGAGALKIVHRETPWRQLSDLFAILCDSIGVARPDANLLPYSKCEGTQRQLLPSGLDIKAAAGDYSLYRWEMNSAFLTQLQLVTQRLI